MGEQVPRVSLEGHRRVAWSDGGMGCSCPPGVRVCAPAYHHRQPSDDDDDDDDGLTSVLLGGTITLLDWTGVLPLPLPLPLPLFAPGSHPRLILVSES